MLNKREENSGLALRFVKMQQCREKLHQVSQFQEDKEHGLTNYLTL